MTLTFRVVTPKNVCLTFQTHRPFLQDWGLSLMWKNPAKDFGGTSTAGNHDLTLLAHPSLVATTVEDVNCNPISVAKAGGPTFTITFSSNTTPLKEEIDYAGMSPV